MKPLRNRIFRAIRSGRIVRMPGSPAEGMDDFTLAGFMVKHYPEEMLEHWLDLTKQGNKHFVSGTPAYSPEDQPDLLAKLSAFAARVGRPLTIEPTPDGGYAIGLEVGPEDFPGQNWN